MLEKQQRRQYDPKVMGESHDTISAFLVVFQMQNLDSQLSISRNTLAV